MPFANYALCWSYDPFGNRTLEALSTTPCAYSPPPTTWATYNGSNQVTGTTQAPGGYTYDGAGNVTNDGLNQYLYDAEGRLCAVAAQPVNGITIYTGYLYNAEGQRVAKGTISAWSCNVATNGFTPTNEYILGQSGEQLSEVSLDEDGVMSWQNTNVYAAGTLMASYDPNGLHFLLNDWLGTRRAQTDFAGNLEQTCQSLPFGNGLTCTASTVAPNGFHYAGLEHDQESGLDHAMARQYASAVGRWMSPDPYDGSMDISNPQTLNRYSYVNNMPLGYTDPSGQDGCAAAASGDAATGLNPIGDAIAAGICIAEIFGGEELLSHIEGLFFHPKFTGATASRPNAQPWDEHGSYRPNPNIGAVLGLPSTGGCEFGACGGSYQAGAGTLPLPPSCLWGDSICSQELAELIAAISKLGAKAIPIVAASATVLTMQGDNSGCMPQAGTQCYQENSGHTHYGWDPHFHIWQRNQNPTTKACFWNPIHGTSGTFPSAPAGMAPCSAYPTWVQEIGQ